MSRLTREVVRKSIEIGRNFKIDEAGRLISLLEAYFKANKIKARISVVDRPGTSGVKLRVTAKAGQDGITEKDKLWGIQAKSVSRCVEFTRCQVIAGVRRPKVESFWNTGKMV